jgi:hypothetical protein
MKKIHLLLTGILWVLFANTGIAQTTVSNDYSVEKVEKEYKGKTYVISKQQYNITRTFESNPVNTSTTISNTDEGAFSGSGAGVCYGLKEQIPQEEILKKALSKEKIKLLAQGERNGIIITFYYDVNTGKVAYLRFRLVGNTTLSNDTESETEITLKDISKLESLFMEYYFDVSKAKCDNLKFGNRYHMFWFSKLAEEEEKE